MKKIIACLLDMIVLLVLLVPTVGYLALKGTTWLAEKAVDGINFVREKLCRDPGDTPRWIHRAGDVLINLMD
jgi:hypothetical protein